MPLADHTAGLSLSKMVEHLTALVFSEYVDY